MKKIRIYKALIVFFLLGILQAANSEIFYLEHNDPDLKKVKQAMDKAKQKMYVKYAKLYNRDRQKEGVVIFNFKYNEKGNVYFYELVESDFEGKKFKRSLKKTILRSRTEDVSEGKGITYKFKFIPQT